MCDKNSKAISYQLSAFSQDRILRVAIAWQLARQWNQLAIVTQQSDNLVARTVPQIEAGIADS
jgi:hypothetical protein